MSCFHCGLPLPVSGEYAAPVLGERRRFCCRGCQAVAEAIVANGLEDYYRHRTALPQTGREIVPAELQKLRLYDHPEIQKTFVHASTGELRQASLILEGITCAACVWLNERHLLQLPGVREVQVNYATHRARVTWDDSAIHLSGILGAIQALGYNAHPFDARQQDQVRARERKQDLRRIAVAGLSASQVMMLSVALYAGDPASVTAEVAHLLRWASLWLTLPVMLYAALPFYRSASRALLARRMNMDVPVTLAIVAAFAGSAWLTWQGDGVVYFDAVGMFALFLLTTRFLERGAREKSAEAAESLLKLVPAFATRLNDGAQESVPVVELRPGDRLLARPGETIAADALVEDGLGSVDEALMTGESRPVAKQPGDAVIAGSVNLDRPLFLRVTGVGEDTVLAGIVRLLDRALAEKPRLAQLADRIAGHFTYALLLLTLAIGAAWLAIEPARAFEICLAVLVVTCPCALSLAAPAVFAAAGSRLLRQGVLLTRGHALETLARVDRVVFDKTGTLTHGKPVLLDTRSSPDLDPQQARRIAASLEQASEHPLAAAFLAAVERPQLLAVNDAGNEPGHGVAGRIAGTRWLLGNRAWLAQHGRAIEPALEAAAPPGASVVWLADGERARAAFVLADRPRPGARALVGQLASAGIRVSMLSGDNDDAVRHVAADTGITDWRANLKPADKLATVRQWQEQGEVVLVIGDGVNDAPVLAGATVSAAMGGGTQVARASADIVLLSENLGDVWRALASGRAGMTIMRQNLVWAVAYNVIALPFAALGFVPPWLAALGMSLSSLVVVMNALRLRHDDAVGETARPAPLHRPREKWS